MPENIVFKRVLILEDEPVISRVLYRALEANGFTVDCAENGVIAKEKIDSGKEFDLFLFDIRTPVISGIQLFEYLEKEYPELTKKVVFMTGDCLNLATTVFLESVNRPVIAKPFTPNQVLDLIKQLPEPELTTV
jgi:CheY-like chemotaxis protein